MSSIIHCLCYGMLEVFSLSLCFLCESLHTDLDRNISNEKFPKLIYIYLANVNYYQI